MPSWHAASIAFMSPRFIVSVRTLSKIIRSRSSFSSPRRYQRERVVELRLGVDVERVGVDARERAADVEHVGRHCREAEQLALVEDRHGDGTSGECEAPG